MARPSVPIPAAGPSAPAPAPPRPRRRNDGVVRSSLELVFSYSRSQQRFFAGLPSAPSFVDYQWGAREGDSEAEDEDYDESREWDPEQGSVTCETCDSADDTEHENDDSESMAADASGFFAVDADRRMDGTLSTVDEGSESGSGSGSGSGSARDGSCSPLTTPTAIPLPAKRGMIMNFFSTTPTANTPGAGILSTSLASSTGSQTPRPHLRPLPDVGPPTIAPSTTAGLSRSLQQRNGVNHGLGLGPTVSVVGHARRPSSEANNAHRAHGEVTASERTPLLAPARTGRAVSIGKRNYGDHVEVSPVRSTPRRQSRVKPSTAAMRGQSGDGQTLFNAVAVLVGVGLLSMPLAFSYAGWIAGTFMVVGFTWLTCHTAKLLARLVFADSALAGYTDIGRKAFGPWIAGTVNILFCIELFAFSVAMLVLFGDSMNVALPELSADMYKFIGFFLVLPTTFLPLNLLSIPSVVSSLATFILVSIVLFDGFWKTTAPGSITDPMPTRLGPEMTGLNFLGGVGLILAGFGGHGVMPNLARDMKHPGSLDRVFNTAFCIAGLVSFLAGAAGYLMIGDGVSDEITRDLMNPEYGLPKFLNYAAVWMIVVTPLTKFGLCSRPLHIAVEGFLNLAPSPEVLAAHPPHHAPQVPPSPTTVTGPPMTQRRASVSAALGSAISQTCSSFGTSDYVSTDDDPFDDYLKVVPAVPGPSPPLNPREQVKEASKGVMRLLSRALITAAVTAAAILLPGFEKVMAFLGSFSAFLICIILPIVFYLRLEPRLIKAPETVALRWQRYAHYLILLVSVILMCLGTVWAFLPGSGRTHEEGSGLGEL